MNATEFRTLAAFDQSLHVGQRVIIHWTNSFRLYEMAATVTKVNAKSVLAAIDEPVYGYYDGTRALLYPTKHVIKVPRLTAIQEWSINNCVMPLAPADDGKPRCEDCNAVGMRHCSDPLHCGGPKPRYRISAIARQIA